MSGGKFLRRLSEWTELPSDAFCRASGLSLSMADGLMVNECVAVLSFSSSSVKLKLCDCTMQVNGSELTLKSFFGKDMRICGCIESIELSGGRFKKA